ncbi:uncharacterized protein LOC125036997 [Penaeus chinensis]|uniref:uncharacterized protein LOC125036997 n=1 Tax=Penaeus chinensis TaxID=139456 RepID=UPI001FB78DFA|nr:uncharacterized protein LOC125036997 [Penaeus chinensis]
MYVIFSLLRYLASGNTLTDLYYTYSIGFSTLSDIIQSVLKNESIPQLTTERLMEIAEKFEENANFPICFGSVDGKHIRVIKPQHSGSLCFNYKDCFSVVLMAVADSQYKFVYDDIGSYGKDSDPTVFSNSTFWKAIVSGELKLPESKHLPNDGGVTVPYVLVGDEAFGLHPNLMRPFGGKMTSVQKRVFNYRLTRARFVECTFGILTNKWRIFHRPLNVSLQQKSFKHAVYFIILSKTEMVTHLKTLFLWQAFKTVMQNARINEEACRQQTSVRSLQSTS